MTNPIRARLAAAVAALALAGLSTAIAGDTGGAAVTPRAEVKWADAGIPGVSRAVVEGDATTGASHFYLRYAAGLVTPVHHHSPDHYVATVTGNLVLVVNGREHRLPPGSYFALTGKAAHAARCEGSEDCVMFIDARGPWDVVPEGKGGK